MKRFVALLTAVCLSITPVAVFAEDTDTDTSTTDVLDNSAELKEVEENGIPTEEIVSKLKETADALYAEESYEEAGEAYYETARKANYLANIMSQCIEPYYSSRSDSKSIPNELIDDLIIFEDKSNELKELRDTCYVYQGICYSKAGDPESALAVLYRALDLITDSETDAWILASQEVMNIIQYKTDEETAFKKEVRSYEGKPYSEFVEKYGEANDKTVYASINSTTYDYDDFWVYTKKEGGEEIIDSITVW